MQNPAAAQEALSKSLLIYKNHRIYDFRLKTTWLFKLLMFIILQIAGCLRKGWVLLGQYLSINRQAQVLFCRWSVWQTWFARTTFYRYGAAHSGFLLVKDQAVVHLNSILKLEPYSEGSFSGS